MPTAETTTKTRRRGRRRVGDGCFRFDSALAREVEDKRRRGEVSCAECRRLKIKCDKQIPCQSCVRRGCTSLCPNGSLSTGQGTRFVLAATEHLHGKIDRLTARIRELEDALGKTQSQFSENPHPLLIAELLELDGSPGPELDFSSDEDVTSPGTALDTHGTLSVSDHGISRFFGATGGCESFVIASESVGEARSMSPVSSPIPLSPTSTISPAHGWSSQHFLFPPRDANPTGLYESVIESLPTWERANSLVNSYFGLMGWFCHGICREHINELLAAVYGKQSGHLNSDYGPHDVSLLLMVFAIGSLAEVEKQFCQDADQLHQLSRIALSQQSLLEKPSLVTAQTIHLMSIYNATVGGNSGSTMETTWSLTRLAAHLAQTIGLHRDGEHWGLSGQVVHRRRLFFWDLYVNDAWQSLHTGRPPSFDLSFIDCKYPLTPGSDGTCDFGIWQCQFTVEIVSKVTSQLLAPVPPSYVAIMDLDKKIRNYPLPDMPSINDAATSWQIFVLGHIRETVLMYLHRNFFAQAFLDDPTNPLRSPYAPSVLAICRASSEILKCVSGQFAKWPRPCGRFWVIWTFSFSAAVVFGTVVTGGPKSPLANSALAELKAACVLFSKAAVVSSYAKKALTVLIKLSDKAHRALSASNDESRSHPLDDTPWISEVENDDLLIFGGRTWFLSRPLADPMESEIPLYNPHNLGDQNRQHSTSPSSSSPARYGYLSPQSLYGFTDEPPHRPELVIDTSSYRPPVTPILLDLQPQQMDTLSYYTQAATDPKLEQWFSFLRTSGVSVEGSFAF